MNIVVGGTYRLVQSVPAPGGKFAVQYGFLVKVLGREGDEYRVVTEGGFKFLCTAADLGETWEYVRWTTRGILGKK